MEEVIKFNCILEHGASFPVHLINNSSIAFGSKQYLKANATSGSWCSCSFIVSINYAFPEFGSLGYQSESGRRANWTGCWEDQHTGRLLAGLHQGPGPGCRRYQQRHSLIIVSPSRKRGKEGSMRTGISLVRAGLSKFEGWVFKKYFNQDILGHQQLRIYGFQCSICNNSQWIRNYECKPAIHWMHSLGNALILEEYCDQIWLNQLMGNFSSALVLFLYSKLFKRFLIFLKK